MKMTLREKCPEAADMWDYDKNDPAFTPDNIGSTSLLKMYFKCKENPKHVFKRKVKRMISRIDDSCRGCIYCGPKAEEAFTGENDIITVDPNIKNTWDYEKNTRLNPLKIFPQSTIQAYFKCENGHGFRRMIYKYIENPTCAKCLKNNRKLLKMHPNTVKFVDYKKNKNIDLKNEASTSVLNVYFTCTSCKYGWESQIRAWSRRGACCPKCGYDGTKGSKKKNRDKVNKKISSLIDVAPLIKDFWDYEKNNYRNPEEIRYTYEKMIWLRCPNNHSFEEKMGPLKNYDRVVCPTCNPNYNNRIFFGENDLFAVSKAAKKMWDYERNNSLNPKFLTGDSSKKAHFKCENGHTFYKNIKRFVGNPVCPQCDFFKNRSVAGSCPQILIFWDYDKMPYDPQKISKGSTNIGYWKCPMCNYSWEQKIYSRHISNNNCPNCSYGDESINESLKADRTFAHNNPNAAKLWVSDMNNGDLPTTVKFKSSKTIYMRCPLNEKHIYPIRVSTIPLESPYGCPSCTEGIKRVIPGLNDFFTICARAKEMWDWNSNKDIQPTELLPTSIQRANFICDRGHRFSKQLKQFTKVPECTVCYRISVRSTIQDKIEIMGKWNFKKNRNMTMENLSGISAVSAWWICSDCGMEWRSQIRVFAKRNSKCPYCTNKNSIPQRLDDFFNEKSEFKKFYDKKMNTESINKKVSSVWWKCPECKYRWKAISFRNTSKRQKFCCPICKNHGLKELYINSDVYGYLYPELVFKYLLKFNGRHSLVKKSKLINSKDSYWWHCTICDYNFKSDIDNMIVNINSLAKGCPYCSKVEINLKESFAYLHSELLCEFDVKNTVDPYKIKNDSQSIVIWNCSKSRRHIWKESVYDRLKGNGCPICNKPNKSDNLNVKSIDEIRRTNYLWNKTTGIALEWGSKNKSDINIFPPDSTYTALWECSKCHGEYLMRICDRYNNDSNCPYCANYSPLVGVNTLKDRSPELSKEWSTKNKLLPEDYTYNSFAVAFWTCLTCHGDYLYQISERKIDDKICPYCSNKIMLLGVNTLAVKRKDLLERWDYINNAILADPNQIMENSNIKVWWFCKNNNNHKFHMTPKKLLYYERRKMEACLYCNGRRRKKRHFF